jgi:quercetin dioxygenase-like cupin family protein
MKVVKIADIEEIKGEGFALWQLINPNTVGSKNSMLFVVMIEPGGKIPVHKHGPADVSIYVLEGRGVFSVNEENQIIEPETALYVPVGDGIGLENIGENTLRFIVAISPPVDVETCPVCGIKIS